MGCGCKDKKINKLEPSSNIKVENKYSLKKTARSLFMMTVVMIISPLILIAIWYYAFMAINGDGKFIGDKIMDLINKGKRDNEEELDEPINEEDYQLLDVEKIN